ncbi:MAG: SDR family NAD(P)-dependent oxidoreductase [Acidimicrobiales bacterium]
MTRPEEPSALGSRNRLEGKRAVVVGAGQSPGVGALGIGRATALLFAREGAELILVDRDESEVRVTQKMIQEEGGRAEVHIADITEESGCQSIGEAAAGFGVDVLQNTVGILSSEDLVDLTEERWDLVMDTNLKSAWMTCKFVLPAMRAQGWGSVINMSSLAGFGGSLTAYAISKAGMNHLTTALAGSNARYGIRVNAIMPGFIDTPMGVDANATRLGKPREQLAEERAAQCPMGYQGDAWDVAYASLYFAADESRYVSGTCLAVDGALSATWYRTQPRPQPRPNS